MARYRVQLYGVPDQQRYAALPVKLWRAWVQASWQIKGALMCAGTGAGLLITFVTRIV
jgi:hypothetical protein